MKIVTVIPLQKGVFREQLTYFSSKEIPSGAVVTISIREKKILGLVVASEDASSIKSDIKEMQFNLKKVIEVKDHSIFRPEYLESLFLTNTYAAGKLNDTVTSLMPNILREEYDMISKWENKTNTPAQASQNIKPEKLLFQAPLEERVSYYKTLIRGNFAEKKSVFMVMPTESDIEKFKDLLSKGIENFTLTFHGRLTPKKMLEKIKLAITEEHPMLILATAPFLSVPRNDIGVIVLEHESSHAYKMMTRPYIDLRNFAEVFAAKIGAKCILGDTILRFETIERKDQENLGVVHPMSFRTHFDGRITLLERESNKNRTGRDPAKEKFKVLMDESVKKIHTAIENKENIFIFSLRKGLGTYTICRDCNETVSCDQCQSPVVLYLSKDGKKRMFSCNRCKRQLDPETVCTNCGGWNLMSLGIGTDTVFEEATRLFPGAKIFRLDKEVVTTARQAKKIIKEFGENPGSILIGTEMAFSYLDDPVPLSIMASFDSLWSIPNYKIGEKIIHLILSLISKTKNEIIIQTKNPQDLAIQTILSENLLPFVREELADRKKLEYPPFKRFIKVSHTGDRAGYQEVKQVLETLFQEYTPQIFSGGAAKSKDKYTTNALIKIDTNKWSLPELSLGGSIDQNLLARLQSLPLSFSINVDPEDLL